MQEQIEEYDFGERQMEGRRDKNFRLCLFPAVEPLPVSPIDKTAPRVSQHPVSDDMGKEGGKGSAGTNGNYTAIFFFFIFQIRKFRPRINK